MSGYHYVRSYRRKDGTLVRGHVRHNPAKRVGAWGVFLFVALMIILGSLTQTHSGTPRTHSNINSTQHSVVAPTKILQEKAVPTRSSASRP